MIDSETNQSTGIDDPARAREDEFLAVRCQLGERSAFDELIARWDQPIWNYARRLTSSDDAADEVVQDVWLRVFRSIHRLRDGSKLRAWLFGIARRALMDRLREQYTAPPSVEIDPDVLAAEGEHDDGLDADLASMALELGRLPVVEREVLTLFYLRELSLAEVAGVLGVPVGTVKSRLFRARSLLRRGMERHQNQESGS